MLLLLLACQRSTPDTTDSAEPSTAASLSLPAYLLIPSGGQGELTATALDAAGDPVAVEVTWHVEDPALLSVSDGVVTPNAELGSTVVTAQLGELVSNPVTVYIARPAPDAVLIADAAVGELQVLEEDPEDLWDLQFSAELDATLQVGDLVIGSGERFPPARVVEVGTPYVMSLVAVDEAFEALEVSGEVADYVMPEPELDVDAPFISVSVGKPLVFAGMDCRFSTTSDTDLLTFTKTDFTLKQALRPSYDYRVSGFSLEHAEVLVQGELEVSADVEAQVSDTVQGKVNCGPEKPIYGRFPLPPFLGGPFVQGFVPIGAGVELDVQTQDYGPVVGFAFSGDVSVSAGAVYDGEGIEGVGEFEQDFSFTPTVDIPVDDDRLQVTAWPYVSVGVGPGIPTVPPKYFPWYEAVVGPKLKADLAAPEKQVQDSEVASSLALDLGWQVGPPQNVTDWVNKRAGHWLLGKLGGNITQMVTFGEDIPIWSSPQGTLTVDTLGSDATEGTLTLDGPAGWAADAVTIRAWDGSALTELDEQPLGESDTELSWAGAGSDAEVYAAFLQTSLLDLPLQVDVVNLGCQQVNMVVDQATFAADVAGDGVDADESLEAQAELTELLMQYHYSQSTYWYGQGQYSLGDYHLSVANNLANEAVGDIGTWGAVKNLDQGLLDAKGGAESDDFRDVPSALTQVVLEAGSASSAEVPAWEDFSEHSATHRFLVAGEFDGDYPLLWLWNWKAATTLDGKVLLRFQDFTGVMAYGSTTTWSLTLDGQELWGGGAVVVEQGESVPLTLGVTSTGYSAADYPSTTESGSYGGDVLRLDVHFEVTGEGCATE